MGHILCYYSDYTETALYTDSARERNVIDCCKVYQMSWMRRSIGGRFLSTLVECPSFSSSCCI